MNATILRAMWEYLNKIRAIKGPNSQEYKDALKEYRKLRKSIISSGGNPANGGTHGGEEPYPDLPDNEDVV